MRTARAGSMVVLLLAIAGCPGGTTSDAGSGPRLVSISPTRGPAAGGTPLTLDGENFEAGATVRVGEQQATEVVFESARRLTARTPPAAYVGARVAVTVHNPSGAESTLAGAFTYEGELPAAIDEAKVSNALDVDLEVVGPTTAVPIFAQVQSTATRGAGQGAGLRAQVGFATALSTPVKAEDFTWSDAVYVGDVDGAATADLARDAYRGEVTVPVPATDAAAYRLAARFSADSSATWTLADADGAANGVQPAQLPTVRVGKKRVGWCKLGGQVDAPPPSLSARSGQSGPTVYGQVYAQGVTDAAGAGAAIEGQLGYGAPGSAPDTWLWAAGAYNVDTSSGSNDEWQATLPVPPPGVVRFTWRFRLAGGPWRVCDADGTDNGFSEAQAGTLTVTAPGVDRCLLQFPPTLTSKQGQPTDTVYARVFGVGVTEAAGANAQLEGQVGFGPPALAPTEAAWAWTAATYNVEVAGGGDEYQAKLTGPIPGTYLYAARFRFQGGPWTVCDLDGSENGFSAAQAGQLEARALTFAVDACQLISVSTASVASGSAVTAVARLKSLGLTDQAAPATGVRAQVGVGTQGTNASSSPLWGWKAASYVGKVAGGLEEYSVQFHPAYTGTRAVAFRFSVDGATWAYCDLNGSDVNGYEVAQQWNLVVGNHADLDYCVLQFPGAVAQRVDGGAQLYGQVYEPGVTPSAGALPAQLGVGARDEDPGLAWSWVQATFNPQTLNPNNDEARATLWVDAGTAYYAFRFSRDGGSYCYGDLDGNGAAIANGFSGDQLGVATVSP